MGWYGSPPSSQIRTAAQYACASPPAFSPRAHMPAIARANTTARMSIAARRCGSRIRVASRRSARRITPARRAGRLGTTVDAWPVPVTLGLPPRRGILARRRSGDRMAGAATSARSAAHVMESRTMRHRARTRRRLIVGGAALLALLVPATTLAAPPAWTRHLGSKAEDVAGGIAADGKGITIVGTTGGKITHKVERRQRRVHPALRPERRGAVDAPVRHRRAGHRPGRRGRRRRPHRAGLDGRLVLGVGRHARGRGHLRPPLRPRRQEALDPPVRAPEDEDPGAIAAGDGGLFVVGTTAGRPRRAPRPATGTPSCAATTATARRSGRASSGRTGRTRGWRSPSTAAASPSAAAPTATSRARTPGPFSDAYLRRYDLAGNVLWTRQWGQEGDDTVLSVAADGTGRHRRRLHPRRLAGQRAQPGVHPPFRPRRAPAVVADLRLARLRGRVGRGGRWRRADGDRVHVR